MKNKLKSLMTKSKVVVMTMWLQMMVPTMVLASQGEPLIVSGTRLLIAALIEIAVLSVAGVMTFNAYKIGLLWMSASAEEKPKYKKEAIQLIAGGVLTFTAGSSIAWVIGFYNPV